MRRDAGRDAEVAGHVPPPRIELDGLVLRRLVVDDADAVASAVAEGFEHIRPWMPWATAEAGTAAFQRLRLRGDAGSWDPAGDYQYGIFLSPSEQLVGGIGLHRRLGPDALEIGYWVHVAHIRRGLATASAAALTSAAFAMTRITRVEIHCDEANIASAAVPRTLGFHLVGTIEHAAEAPAETGRRMVWEVTAPQWATLQGS